MTSLAPLRFLFKIGYQRFNHYRRRRRHHRRRRRCQVWRRIAKVSSP